MKKLINGFLVLALLASMLSPITSNRASAATNLLANSSVESATDTTKPDNWTANSWGTNTSTLTYATNGNTGSRSLLVNTTARTNGDAKWMHDAVTVTPNTSYTYSSFYKSSIDTEIDLQYTTSTGAVSYAYSLYVPASSAWKELSTTFVTPAGVTKVVVMHILAAVGTLQTDDFTLAATVAAPPASDDNFISNEGFETANGSSPVGWDRNSWGTNTTNFKYETTGRTGTRSATATVSAYTSGDAKWFAAPVTVIGGKSYVYRDYYKSNVTTRVVVAFISSTGAYTYSELPLTAPASASAWSQYNATFTVPTTAVKATVYHLISAVGYLTIDDVVLAYAPPAEAAKVPNGSLETASTATTPASWQSSSWGTNKPTFAYATGGRTGTKSVKVTMANYTDGDAKWFFTPITTLTPGKQYRFTNWYKTTAKAPKVVALYIDAAGVERYVGMQSALPGANSSTVWQQYTDTFSVPVGTVSVSVFMLIAENGWLQTDDYSITDYVPTGFSRPLLTLTFDDGHEDNITNALPLLTQYGFKSTQCYATTFIEGIPSAVTEVKKFYAAGHEICSHTVTHPFLSQLAPATLTYELQHSQQYLKSILGVDIKNFASPYGDYNAAVNTEIKKYYQSHRTVDEGFNSKDNLDLYRLKVQNILDTTSAAQVKQWIDQAKVDKTWLILVYHRIASDPGPYDSYTTVFKQHLDVIKASGITVKTLQDSIVEVKAQ